MKIRLLGGLAVEHDGEALDVAGAMQRALLFRLALDAGSQLGYRALAEDVWPDDPPENARAALQSLVSRLRAQLPEGTLESVPGGYRLAIGREDVDAVRFQDLVAAASAAPASEAPGLASAALELWAGEPWTPGAGYDWLERDLAADRATALRLGGVVPSAVAAPAVPAQLTAFIGRDEELASVAGQLARGRLVTILGPGGAGKTRLALEAARERQHPVIVELAPAGPDELWQAILGAVGREVRAVGETQAASPLDRVVAALAGREMLLVLDNCEHLIDAAATAAHQLLETLPRLRILATSREPLGVPGEAFVPLGPLAPDAAARLFADRVLSARGRPLDAEEADAATRIRKRLDGLPLALELAAAKVRTMTIEEVAAGLDDRFALLSGGLRTVLPRHQTLRALVDWSWSLLGERERLLLAALSIYPAGVAVRDADDVAAAHGATRAEFDALVDKSLLQRASGRFRALETIREYGLERLAESGQLDRHRLVQARHLAEVARRRDAELRTSAIHDALAWFDAEDDNIAGALRYCVDAGHRNELVRLAGDCAWYWIIRDRNEDALLWLDAADPAAAGESGDEAILVRTAAMMVRAFSGFGRGEQADRLGADELARLRRDARGSAHDLVQVLPILLESFARVLELGPSASISDVQVPDVEGLDLRPWGRGMLSVMRAAMAQNRGDVADLGEASGHAVILFEQVGDLWGLALAKQMRAEWLLLEDRLEEALVAADESTTAMRTITSSWDLQQQQGLAVGLLLRLGRIEEARMRADQLLREARESGAARAIVLACSTAVFLAIDLGDRETAARLMAESDLQIDDWADWIDATPQIRALQGVARSGIALLDGDFEAAETLLRDAAEAAVTSHDRPIMALVAVGVGSLAIATKRIDDAITAIDLAEALRGAPDLRNPTEARIRSAIAEARPTVEREERASPDRASAVETLTQILRR